MNKDRLVSLDAFRGLTIAAMILVNNPGDWGHVYWPLGHAPWHGWTPTDLIFPFFLFIVGVSLTLSKRIGSRPALSRALKLVGLGLLLNLYPYFPIAELRWRPGPRSATCARGARPFWAWPCSSATGW